MKFSCVCPPKQARYPCEHPDIKTMPARRSVSNIIPDFLALCKRLWYNIPKTNEVRKMRMRKKKNLIPRMEACGALRVQEPEKEKGRWRERKPDAARLYLELGCGKGRFTAETAAAHPDDLYVAIERVPDAMVIAMERCQALGLTNVFFIDGDAAALDQYFAPGEVDLIFINFCDPWPSVKHSRRRLTHVNFLRGYRRVLKEGGQIQFKTDNHDLFEWSLFQFPKVGFALSEVTRNLHEHGVQGVMTDYEEKFHALGTPINRCVGTMEAWSEEMPAASDAVQNETAGIV